VLQQLGQPAHDGQPKAQAFLAVAFRIAQLMEFVKDFLLLLRVDADAAVPYLQQQLIATAAAATRMPPRWV
jgi:hypothetical protein